MEHDPCTPFLTLVCFQLRTNPLTERSWQSWLGVIRPISRRKQTGVRHQGRTRPGHPLLLEALENRLALFFVLGTTTFVEGPAGGTFSDIATGSGNWTAKANNSWLDTTSSGTGNGLATIHLEGNPGGPTRIGALTIAGQTLTVTQAGARYMAANRAFTLVSTGLKSPRGVAVDGAGNVYIADTDDKTIKELPRAFVPGTPITETAAAGSGMLQPVLPTTTLMAGVFAPSPCLG